MRWLALACAALVCAPASAQVMKLHPAPARGGGVAVVTSVGTPFSSGSATATATVTGVTSSAGNPLIVLVTVSPGHTFLCTDPVNGSTGWVSTVPPTGVSSQAQGYCYNLSPLALSGQTITVTPSVSDFITANAAQISGASITAVDIVGPGAFGAGTSATLATGTLGQPNEVIIGSTDLGGNGGATVSPGTGFTALTPTPVTGGSDSAIWAWKSVSSTATTNYDPAWTNSLAYSINVITFR